MHLYTRIALLMAIASVAKCSTVLDEMSQEHLTQIEGKEISLEHESHRDGKRIKSKRTILAPLLNLIDFDDANCTLGMCLSHKECGNKEGFSEVPNVRCASGFGVCCVNATASDYEGGNVTIGPDGGNFFNEGTGFNPQMRISGRQEEECSKIPIIATLEPADNAVQIKIDIINLNILGPEEGDCANDSLVVTGANPGLDIPILCGLVTEQTLYIGIENSAEAKQITLTIDQCEDYDRTWNITVSFLTEADAVPHRCLQYFTEPSGTIQSLNFQGSDSHIINDQQYSICFKYISGKCDVHFAFSRLDLGRIGYPCHDKFLLTGNQILCGDFADYTVTGNASVVNVNSMNVVTGSWNDNLEEGFKATYMMADCT